MKECHITKFALSRSFLPIDLDKEETTPPPIAPAPIIPDKETNGYVIATLAKETIPNLPAKKGSANPTISIKNTETIFGAANLKSIECIGPFKIN
tara:strand:+ start:43 stop:327 length:285 start_codon:yes stop_codon:yes gene_type:complete